MKINVYYIDQKNLEPLFYEVTDENKVQAIQKILDESLKKKGKGKEEESEYAALVIDGKYYDDVQLPKVDQEHIKRIIALAQSPEAAAISTVSATNEQHNISAETVPAAAPKPLPQQSQTSIQVGLKPERSDCIEQWIKDNKLNIAIVKLKGFSHINNSNLFKPVTKDLLSQFINLGLSVKVPNFILAQGTDEEKLDKLKHVLKTDFNLDLENLNLTDDLTQKISRLQQIKNRLENYLETFDQVLERVPELKQLYMYAFPYQDHADVNMFDESLENIIDVAVFVEGLLTEVETKLNEVMDAKYKNCIIVRTWYPKHDLTEQRQMRGINSDGHTTIQFYGSHDKQVYLGFYISQQNDKTLLAQVFNKLHLPSPEEGKGYFVSLDDDLSMLGPEEGKRYKRCEEVVIPCDEMGLDFDKGYRWAIETLNKYPVMVIKDPHLGEDQKTRIITDYNFWTNNCASFAVRGMKQVGTEKHLKYVPIAFMDTPTGAIEYARNVVKVANISDIERKKVERAEYAKREYLQLIQSTIENLRKISTDSQIEKDLIKQFEDTLQVLAKADIGQFSSLLKQFGDGLYQGINQVSEETGLSINQKNDLTRILDRLASLLPTSKSTSNLNVIDNTARLVFSNAAKRLMHDSNYNNFLAFRSDKKLDLTDLDILLIAKNWMPSEKRDESRKLLIAFNTNNQRNNNEKSGIYSEFLFSRIQKVMDIVTDAFTKNNMYNGNDDLVIFNKSMYLKFAIMQLKDLATTDSVHKNYSKALQQFYSSNIDFLQNELGNLNQQIYFRPNSNGSEVASDRNQCLLYLQPLLITDNECNHDLSIQNVLENSININAWNIYDNSLNKISADKQSLIFKSQNSNDLDSIAAAPKKTSIFNLFRSNEYWQYSRLEVKGKIYGVLNSTLPPLHKIEKIKQLIDESKPSSLNLFRGKERAFLLEMQAKSTLICLTEALTKGHINEVDFYAYMEKVKLDFKDNGLGKDKLKKIDAFLREFKKHYVNMIAFLESEEKKVCEGLIANDQSTVDSITTQLVKDAAEQSLNNKQSRHLESRSSSPQMQVINEKDVSSDQVSPQLNVHLDLDYMILPGIFLQQQEKLSHIAPISVPEIKSEIIAPNAVSEKPAASKNIYERISRLTVENAINPVEQSGCIYANSPKEVAVYAAAIPHRGFFHQKPDAKKKIARPSIEESVDVEIKISRLVNSAGG